MSRYAQAIADAICKGFCWVCNSFFADVMLRQTEKFCNCLGILLSTYLAPEFVQIGLTPSPPSVCFHSLFKDHFPPSTTNIFWMTPHMLFRMKHMLKNFFKRHEIRDCCEYCYWSNNNFLMNDCKSSTYYFAFKMRMASRNQ